MRRFLAKIIKKITFAISKATTAIVLTLGALVNIRQPERMALAGLVFIVGLPVGLIVFGSQFNMFIWMSIVICTLFLINLHNAWQVMTALAAGALDHEMVVQAEAAVNTVVPDPKAVKTLLGRVKTLNENYNQMAVNHVGYSGEILLPFNNGDMAFLPDNGRKNKK